MYIYREQETDRKTAKESKSEKARARKIERERERKRQRTQENHKECRGADLLFFWDRENTRETRRVQGCRREQKEN